MTSPLLRGWLGLLVCLWLLGSGRPLAADAIATFEDLSLPPESFWNGSDGSGGFTSGGMSFNNSFTFFPDFNFEYWDGWSYSNRTDIDQSGPAGQYTAYSSGGGGVNGSSNYGVAFDGTGFGNAPTVMALPGPPIGAYFTNTAYAFHTIRDGDAFAFPFAADDVFRLTIEGRDTGGAVTGAEEFYLADYRNGATDIVDDWTWVDFSALGSDTRSLQFTLFSNNANEFGPTTPFFFAMDNLTVQDLSAAPEPGSLVLGLAATAIGAAACRFRRRRRATSAPDISSQESGV